MGFAKIFWKYPNYFSRRISGGGFQVNSVGFIEKNEDFFGEFGGDIFLKKAAEIRWAFSEKTRNFSGDSDGIFGKSQEIRWKFSGKSQWKQEFFEETRGFFEVFQEIWRIFGGFFKENSFWKDARGIRMEFSGILQGNLVGIFREIAENSRLIFAS